MRIPERISHARLCGQMDDDRKSMPRKQFRNRNAIGEIQPFELKARVVAKDIEPGRLQPRIIIVIEIVDPDDAMAGLQQPLRYVESDEARGPRYQNCLIRHCHPCILQPMPWRHMCFSTPPISADPRRSTESRSAPPPPASRCCADRR